MICIKNVVKELNLSFGCKAGRKYATEALVKALLYARASVISVKQLVRTLKRDGELREACGLGQAPHDSLFSKLKDKLSAALQQAMDGIVAQLTALGILSVKDVVVDATRMDAYCNTHKGRKDKDARWGYDHIEKRKYYGYKAHIAVDADTELPLAVTVTPANTHDSQQAIPLLQEVREKNMRFNYAVMDSAYDSAEIKKWVRSHSAKDIIAWNRRGTKDKFVLNAGTSAEFKQHYCKRSAIERVNSRLKEFFSLNGLKAKGMKAAQFHALLSCTAMLTLALGAVLHGMPHLMRTITAFI